MKKYIHIIFILVVLSVILLPVLFVVGVLEIIKSQ